MWWYMDAEVKWRATDFVQLTRMSFKERRLVSGMHHINHSIRAVHGTTSHFLISRQFSFHFSFLRYVLSAYMQFFFLLSLLLQASCKLSWLNQLTALLDFRLNDLRSDARNNAFRNSAFHFRIWKGAKILTRIWDRGSSIFLMSVSFSVVSCSSYSRTLISCGFPTILEKKPISSPFGSGERILLMPV